tara:strand:- start:1271 stop:1780 length:510 start_codon:yes stop_codon:yes gene_type:complete
VHPRALEHRRQTPCRGCRAPVDLVAIVVFGLSLSRAPWWVGGLLAAIGAVDWLLLTLSQAAYSLLWRPLALLGWLLPALWEALLVAGPLAATVGLVGAAAVGLRRGFLPALHRRDLAFGLLICLSACLSGPGRSSRSLDRLPRGHPCHAARRRAQHPRLRLLLDAATVK